VSQKSAVTSVTAQSGEVVSLAERMGYLQALRVAFAAAVLVATLLGTRVVGATLQNLLPITAGYLLLSATSEGLRRLGKGRGLTVIGGMLLIDGLYLAWVMYSTGGTQSPLRFLVYLHLIAVTLLASYRTGLKVTLWHTLLFFVVYYAQAAEILDPKEQVGALPGTGSGFQRLSVFNVMAFWMVALGTAAFSALNERELRRRKVDVEALAAMASKLESEAPTPQEIAQTLLSEIGESFGFKRGVVLAGASGDLQLLAFSGPGEAPSDPGSEDPVIADAFRARSPLLRKQFDGDVDKRLATLMPMARNVVVVPLFAEGNPIGVLAAEYPQKTGRIERRIVAMLSQFAAHASLALRNAWLLQQVQKMADTDALTGVANRRMFEETLARELSRSMRNGEQVTLMMIDVDHFKKFNDEYGHLAGDAILRGVGRKLVEGSRDFDTPARYGGEEFAVILPSCSSRESLAVTERLRKSISAIEAPSKVTASAGVATFPIHASDPDSLIKAADEALYESKRSGRDRVTRSRRRASKPAVSLRTDE
jgi:two-component system, cell cycle response regulator